MHGELEAFGEQALGHQPELLERRFRRSLRRYVHAQLAIADPIRPRHLILAAQPIRPPDAFTQGRIAQSDRAVARIPQIDHDPILARYARAGLHGSDIECRFGGIVLRCCDGHGKKQSDGQHPHALNY